MLICVSINLANPHVLYSFVDRGMVMRYFGGRIGHVTPVTPELQDDVNNGIDLGDNEEVNEGEIGGGGTQPQDEQIDDDEGLDDDEDEDEDKSEDEDETDFGDDETDDDVDNNIYADM